MTVPHTARIALLVLASTAFYTYVGQLVPQSEVHPPAEIAIKGDLTTADMVKLGRELMGGKGLCLTCHTIGKTGALRFPDLEGIGSRAQSRVPGMSDIDYLAESLYEPNKFIVPGFNPGMPVINKPPIGLTDQEILAVIAYLQSLGGTPTVTLQSTHRYLAGAPGVAPTPAAPKTGTQLRPDVPSLVAAHHGPPIGAVGDRALPKQQPSTPGAE
jgi:mono/diheme cytochrome c family protein